MIMLLLLRKRANLLRHLLIWRNLSDMRHHHWRSTTSATPRVPRAPALDARRRSRRCGTGDAPPVARGPAARIAE